MSAWPAKNQRNLTGHGPGVTTLMTCETSLIKPVVDPKANIADRLGIGTAAKL